MLSQPNNYTGQKANLGKTIDLQGVAAFVGLVELLATELGVPAGRIQGLLPSGPESFDELVGEIAINTHGFRRTLWLLAKPGSSLKLRFQCVWQDGHNPDPQAQPIGGVESHVFLDGTVEQIATQGRALARHIEETFTVLDKMVTLGKSSKLSAMAPSAQQIDAFENSTDGGNLVKAVWPKKAASFEP